MAGYDTVEFNSLPWPIAVVPRWRLALNLAFTSPPLPLTPALVKVTQIRIGLANAATFAGVSMTRKLSVMAIALFLCGCGKSDYQSMHSFWTVVSAEEGGKEADPRKKKDVFIDSEILVNDMAAMDLFWTDPPGHHMKIDAAKNPKQIDVDKWPGIYELKGDDLKVCLDLGGKTRPTDFKTSSGDQFLLLVMKRKKL